MRALRPTVLVLVALALAACGSSDEIDIGKAERVIRDGVSTQLGVPVEVVRCPEKVKRAKGNDFSCTATIGTESLRIKVVQTDGKGNVRYSNDQAVIDLRKARDEIAGSIKQQTGIAVSVDCGERHYEVHDPKDTFECKASDGTVQRTVRITVKDTQGNIDFEVE